MQPREPETGADPTPPPTPPVPPDGPGPANTPTKDGSRPLRVRRGRLQSRRARLLLALGGGVMALLCLGGVGVLVALYDEATEVKRSEPDVVVDSFLRAYLVNRDDKEAALFECKTGGDFAGIAGYRSQILSDEKKYSLGIRVSWTSLSVSVVGGKTSVGTQLRRAFSDGSERVTDDWEFYLEDQDGWRVCGAKQVS